MRGAIVCDETIRQATTGGTPFVRFLESSGIAPGIMVHIGAEAPAGFPREKVTEGLEGLRGRLKAYFATGAHFPKWREVITSGGGTPSPACIVNAQGLGRYAALCQEAGLVSIVEPQVLMGGAHSLDQYRKVTAEVLDSVFTHLRLQGMPLEGITPKPNMVLPGLNCLKQPVDEVGAVTVDCPLRVMPAAVPGIGFLSGGQSDELAFARLNATNARFKNRGAEPPWAMAFSFGRAIQQPALAMWHGQAVNVVTAQEALLHRARCNRAARRGEYDPAADLEAAA